MIPALLPLLPAFAQEPSPRPDAAPRADQDDRDDEDQPSRPERAAEPDKAKADGKAAKDKEPEKPEEPPVVTTHELRLGAKVLRYKVTDRLHAPEERGGQDRGAHLLYGLRGRPHRRSLDAAAHVLVQRRPRVILGVAAPGRARPQAREDDATTAAARAALRAGGQRPDAGSSSPTSCSSTRWARATAGHREAGARQEVLGRAGRHPVGGEFIRLYLTRQERWASPLFLVGESYGTTRAAGCRATWSRRGSRSTASCWSRRS